MNHKEAKAHMSNGGVAYFNGIGYKYVDGKLVDLDGKPADFKLAPYMLRGRWEK